MLTYFSRTSHFDHVTVGSPEGGLTTDHVGTIAQHENAHKRIAIGVPTHDRLVVFVVVQGPLLVGLVEFLLYLLFGLHREIDVSDLVIRLRD